MTSFKQQYSFYDRFSESSQIMLKYSNKFPVICEPGSSLYPPITKKKYLVAGDVTLGQFIHAIRPRIQNITAEKALFMSVKNGSIIPSISSLICNLYDKYRDPDGFIYITYSLENTFG